MRFYASLARLALDDQSGRARVGGASELLDEFEPARLPTAPTVLA